MARIDWKRIKWPFWVGGAILLLLLLFVVRSGNETPSPKGSPRVEAGLQREKGADSQGERALVAKLEEARRQFKEGHYLSARQIVEGVLNSAQDQELLESAGRLLQEIDFAMITNPVQIEGETVEYVVKPGDTLYGIAKRFNTTVEFIKLRNHLTSDIIKPGQRLSIYTGKFSIVVDKSQNELRLYANGRLIKTYKVSTGKNDLTPEGTFKIVTKLKDPTFFHDGKAIPPGDPENILGSRWMGFDYGNGSYGIHGTTSPETIGTYETNGCVRMRNEDVEELFAIVPKGTEVKVVK